jgi:hypothetical protein
MFVTLSSFASSPLLSSCARNLVIFLGFATLAAAMGMVLEKSARFRTALTDRTIGGRKRDMVSGLVVKPLSYNCGISWSIHRAEECTHCHDCIVIREMVMICVFRES